MYYIYTSIYLSIYLSIIYLSRYLSIYLRIYLSIHPSLYLSILGVAAFSLYLSINQYIYLFINLCFYLPSFLSIYLSNYLSIQRVYIMSHWYIGSTFVYLHYWVSLMSTLCTGSTLCHPLVGGRPYVGLTFCQVDLLSLNRAKLTSPKKRWTRSQQRLTKLKNKLISL